MTDATNLCDAVQGLLDQVGRAPLQALQFDAVEPQDLDEFMARLSVFLAPAYLPLFRDRGGGTMVAHAWPGRALADCPLLYVSDDRREARFVCDRLNKLPVALWLWIGCYYKTKPEALRQATSAIAATLPGAQPVPEELWALLKKSPEFTPTWWAADADRHTLRAWVIADVGHPFAGAPKLSGSTTARKALKLLEPFVASRPGVPELQSTLLATRVEARKARNRDEVLGVLSAEAWREQRHVLNGPWRATGEGMCEWDCTLRHIDNPESVLGSTPFAALIGHPETYSGRDPEAVHILSTVARAFRAAGDREGELRQLRNAATIALQIQGGFTSDVCASIAEACDAISPDSLAAAIARETARVQHLGP